MARKSNVTAALLSNGDAETKEVIDVNMAPPAGDEPKATGSEDANVDADVTVAEDNTEQTPSVTPSDDANVDADVTVAEDNTEQTPSVAPSEKPTVKPDEEDPTPAVEHKELTKSLAAATGIGGLDIDKILAECKTDDDKKKAYERVLWHVGRIKSCNIESHLMHQGRYNQDGSESKLVKDLKTAFGQK